MSLSQENINGRNKSLFLSAEHQLDATQTQNEAFFYSTELLTWCRQRHYRGGLQYACQEGRLQPGVRPTVVCRSCVGGRGWRKKAKREWGATVVRDTSCTSEARRAKKKNRVSSYIQEAKLLHQREQAKGAWNVFPGCRRRQRSGWRSLGRAESTEGESVDIRAEV